MLAGSINRIKSFFKEDPKRAKLIGLFLLLLAIPITVLSALKVQNILQHAGGGSGVQIVDANGNIIGRTSDPNVYLKITLPPDWLVNVRKSQNNNLVEETYAQSSCPTITCGTNSGAGGVCTYGTSPNSNVSGCTATCPNGKIVPGFSVSVCQSNSCYFNDCTCYPNPGECDNQPVSTPTPVSIPTTALKGQNCHAAGFDSDICSGNPFGAGGACEFGSSNDVSLPCTKTCPDGSRIEGRSISSCNPDGCYYNSCSCQATCPGDVIIPTPTPVSTPSGTPDFHFLKSLYITNSDADGSSGGSDSLNITENFDKYLTGPFPWRLNSLLPGQTEASRIVQVTLFDGTTFVPYVATVTLFRATQGSGVLSRVEVSFDRNSPGCTTAPDILKGYECGISALAYDTNNFPIFEGISYQWSISSANSIGTLGKLTENITTFYAQNFGLGNITVFAKQGDQVVQKSIDIAVVQRVLGAKTVNADINRDGKVNQKDIDILLSEFGKRGLNLPADLNRDGVVDGKDYQILKNQ